MHNSPFRGADDRESASHCRLCAHHVGPGIDREGRCRRASRRPSQNRRQRPRGVVQSRRVSQPCRLGRVAGCGITGERRTRRAHLHRPRRALDRRVTRVTLCCHSPVTSWARPARCSIASTIRRSTSSGSSPSRKTHHPIVAADCGYALRRSGTIPRAAG